MTATQEAIAERIHSAESSRSASYLPMQEVCEALVLDAQFRQSLVSVRSLGRKHIRVGAVETFDGVPAFSSKWCLQKAVLPAREATPDYFKCLQQVLSATSAKVIIPSSDGTIALIRRHRKTLERRTRVALAKEPALGIAVNKGQTLEIARRLGLLIPRGVDIASVRDVDAAIREVGLPAVVKPEESWMGDEKSGIRFSPQLVTTLHEAQQVVASMTRFGGNLLFQQFLDGRREAV
ncbi:MAG TPA: hypothetical protein VKY31_04855, partial [Terriglobia bacterium]|nr:hypothetical protein [Terriglobia bacterium]